ncbi:hypothetical protein AB0C29_32645 [Actinoplanes sp. NPDC048791]
MAHEVGVSNGTSGLWLAVDSGLVLTKKSSRMPRMIGSRSLASVRARIAV